LPKDSLYLDIVDDFERRLVHSQDGAMKNDIYARSVVAESLRPAWRQRKWLWSGNKTFLVWFVRTFLGAWLFDWILPRMFGLDRLKKLVRGRESRA
jgi:1-acylglycerone phosphate reductase